MARVVVRTDAPTTGRADSARHRAVVDTEEVRHVGPGDGGHDGGDDAAVDDTDDSLVDVPVGNSFQRVHAPGRQLGRGLGTGDMTPLTVLHRRSDSWVALSGALTELAAFPLAEKYLTQVALDGRFQPDGSNEWRSGLHGTPERRHIDGGDRRPVFVLTEQASSGVVGLGETAFGEPRITVAVDQRKGLSRHIPDRRSMTEKGDGRRTHGGRPTGLVVPHRACSGIHDPHCPAGWSLDGPVQRKFIRIRCLCPGPEGRLKPSCERADALNVDAVNPGRRPLLPLRRIAAALPSERSTTWTPSKPEVSAVANGLSLLMPTLEPFVMKAVRAGAADERVDPELRARALSFVHQEGSHQHAHREFNRGLISRVPVLHQIERAQRRVFRALDDRGSTQSVLAHAAGAEAVAYFTARWVDRRRHSLLGDASGPVATMFVWHLAEEVEHKDVAYDLYRANGGGRARYLLGIISALMIFALSVVSAGAVLIVHERQWWRPAVHGRMIWWSLSFVFDVLPVLGLCLLKDHHPDRWTDPDWLTQWLSVYDRQGGVAPAWNRDTLDGVWADRSIEATVLSATAVPIIA